MTILLFSIATIAPTFIVIFIGAFLRKKNFLDTRKSSDLSGIVFHLLLPALIIKTLATMDKNSSLTIPIILAVFIFYFGTILLSWIVSLFLKCPAGERGYFMTGASFGNNAIIGYAFGAALYGEEGIARAALLSAVLMPLSILTSGIMLTPGNQRKKPVQAIREFTLSMIRNPVMVALVLGIILWRSPVILPETLLQIFTMLAQAALPIALLAVGSSLEFRMERQEGLEIAWTTILKLFVMPAMALAAGQILRLSPKMTGSLLLMAACPSSLSYYIMARNLGHAPSKGAAVVTVTTTVSALSAAAIAFYLKYRGWV